MKGDEGRRALRCCEQSREEEEKSEEEGKVTGGLLFWTRYDTIRASASGSGEDEWSNHRRQGYPY